MSRTLRQGLPALAACLLAALLTSGCGGSGGAGTTAATTATATTTAASTTPSYDIPALSSNPATPIAHVGSYTITTATLKHWMRIYSAGRGESVVPYPPEYTECVAALKRELKTTDGTPPATPSQIRHLCEVRYNEVKEGTLGLLIYNHWLIQSGHEYGANVTVAEAQAQRRRQKAKKPPKQVELKALAKTGQTEADFVLETQANMIQEKLRAKALGGSGAVSQKRIAAYYAANRSSYEVPEKRDLKIVRALTQATAAADRQELLEGQSFEAVVAQSHVPQPIYSSKGLVLGLAPGIYSEEALNKAIFTAKPNVLSGVVHISLGYYVFEVKKIHPASVTPLAAVEKTIREELPEKLDNKALERFLTGWKAKWTSRTTCEADFVIWKCKGFSGAPPTGEEPASFF